MDRQPGFFDLDYRYEQLSKSGDPLVRLSDVEYGQGHRTRKTSRFCCLAAFEVRAHQVLEDDRVTRRPGFTWQALVIVEPGLAADGFEVAEWSIESRTEHELPAIFGGIPDFRGSDEGLFGTFVAASIGAPWISTSWSRTAVSMPLAEIVCADMGQAAFFGEADDVPSPVGCWTFSYSSRNARSSSR